MTDMTRTQLVNEIADLLFVGAAGQTLSAEDYTYIDARIDAILDELVERDVLPYAPRDEVPGAWYNPIAEYCANEVGPRFGQPKNDAVRQSAEERLKVVLRPRAASPYLGIDTALTATAVRGTYNGT